MAKVGDEAELPEEFEGEKRVEVCHFNPETATKNYRTMESNGFSTYDWAKFGFRSLESVLEMENILLNL